jgi:hypothetical protein
MSNQQITPLVWTHEETSIALGVSPMTGERRRREGDWPPAIKIGAKLFYRPDDVRAWLATKPTQQSSGADRTAPSQMACA